jgi:hypothetical protein
LSGGAENRILPRAFVAGALLAFALFDVHRLYRPYTFLIGDCPYYAATAVSIFTDHDLDLRNQLEGGLEVHATQVAEGLHGEWYPKHPILMPLVTGPLFTVFGTNGFLVANVGCFVLLGLVLYELSRDLSSPLAAVAGVLATMLGSFIVRYDYNYSPNLFACVLCAASVVALVRRRPAVAGVLAGLACFGYTPDLVALAALSTYAAARYGRRAVLSFALAAAPALVAQAALNFHMFGSPLVSPYMRILTLDDHGMALHSQVDDFTNPMLDGIRAQLFDRTRGLLWTAPVLLLAVPGYGLWGRRQPDRAFLCLAIGILFLLFFSRYRLWTMSSAGNRFLMPLVALSAPAVGATIAWLVERRRRTPA